MSVRWESPTSLILCLPSPPPSLPSSQHTDGHRSALPTGSQEQAAARGALLPCLCGAGLCLPKAEEES